MKPLIKYLKKRCFKKIWCPFDKLSSKIVNYLLNEGFSVLATHIDDGQDFFKLNEQFNNYDCIVSNPPYSVKTEVLEKLYRLGKPFAMLLPLQSGLETAGRQDLYKRNGIQLLIPDHRVGYYDEKKEVELGSPSFLSCWFCWKILDKDIEFTNIEKRKEEWKKDLKNV